MSGGARWKDRLEMAGLGLVSLPLGPLGWRGTQRLGAILGLFAYRALRIRRDVALANLRSAFGRFLGEKEIEALARATYRQWGTTFFEVARFAQMGPSDAKRLVRLDRGDILDRVRAEGRGAILFTGHYGNFDLFAATIAARGYPLSVVVQKQRNSLVEARLTLTRERMGERVIARGGGAREILRALERNEFIAILGDQDAHEGGVFVDFFGRPASTPRGPARLARLAGAPLVFAVLERVEDGTHVARIEDPIYPEAGSDEEAEVVRLTTAVTRLLEGAVRRRPDHYLWVHRRWKTRPPGEETGR